MDWNLDSFFPKFAGSEMVEFRVGLCHRIDEAKDRFAALKPLSPQSCEHWEEALGIFEEITSRFTHLEVYLGCLSAADATDEQVLTEQADLARLEADLLVLRSQLLTGLQGATEEELESLTAREGLQDAEFAVRRLWETAQRRMSLPEEALAAKLAVDGIGAWSRLYGTLSGNLEFEMAFPDGKVQTLPISQCRSLMTNPDRRIREAAFKGGNKAWAGVALTMKAALNGIGGTRLTLYERRGISDFMDQALRDAHLERQTLDALFEGIDANLELSRSMIRDKAERMGRSAIAWFDLEASMPEPEGKESHEPLSWDAALQMVSEVFHRAYPSLGDFFDEICEKRWFDWSQRPGKRPGGFCATSDFHGESRIFLTFNECAHDLMTLAHEVGHAWHSRLLQDRRRFAKGYPMTLAEAASTFAELLLVEGILNDERADRSIQRALLNQAMGHGSAFLLDIPVRYHFEREFYERRAAGELSVSELNELMVATQRRVFGDSLQEGEENPLFWASKGHFFIEGMSFYNFPYTFGYLLSRAMLARYQSEGGAFLETYESFLRESGSHTCEEVVRRTLGSEIGEASFWTDAIGALEPVYQRVKAFDQD